MTNIIMEDSYPVEQSGDIDSLTSDLVFSERCLLVPLLKAYNAKVITESELMGSIGYVRSIICANRELVRIDGIGENLTTTIFSNTYEDIVIRPSDLLNFTTDKISPQKKITDINNIESKPAQIMIAIEIEDDQGGRYVISDRHIHTMSEFQEALDLGYDFYTTTLDYDIAVLKIENFIDSRSDVVEWSTEIEDFDDECDDCRLYDEIMLNKAYQFLGE